MPTWQPECAPGSGITIDAAPPLMHTTASDQRYRAPMAGELAGGANSLGKIIKDARVARGWSQDELADKAGVGRATVQRYELGTPKPRASGAARTRTPNPDAVRAIFKALDLDPREAAIALGFVTREEMGMTTAAPRKLSREEQEVLDVLRDPAVPSAEKEPLVDYLKHLRSRRHTEAG